MDPVSFPLPLAVVMENSWDPSPIGKARTFTPAESTVWVEVSEPEETVTLPGPVVRAATKMESAGS